MRCISSVSAVNNKQFSIQNTNNKNTNFKNMPQRIGYMSIKNYEDALRCWEKLRFAKYLDVHSDHLHPEYKNIRMENYSFLDKLTSYIDKSEFIQKFCDFTHFPYLKSISAKIENTFRDCVDSISKDLCWSHNTTGYRVLDKDCDPTCSVKLGKAFPGSDLDKGYVILEGGSESESDTKIVDNFKGALWERLDNRIASQTHPETTIEVYTKGQIRNILDSIKTPMNCLLYKPDMWTLIGATVSLGLGSVLGYTADVKERQFIYKKRKNSNETNPYEAAEFNKNLSKFISSPDKKEQIKNFAFFIETVDANYKNDSYGKYDSIFRDIANSKFVQYSNVTQIPAWQRIIKNGYLKTKLKNREQLERDFSQMAIEEKYELIKDVIKSASCDQSYRFSEYFKNDDDIKERYTKLINRLTK